MKRFALRAGLAIGLIWGICGGAASAQGFFRQPRTYDVAAGFTAVHANISPGQCSCFYMYGGSAQGAVNLSPRFSVLADAGITRARNTDNNGHNLTLSTYQAGVRLSHIYADRFKGYVQVLGGVGSLTSNFKIDSGALSAAYTAGGGVDFRYSRHFDLRLVQVEYLHTSFANGADDYQNQVRFTTGVILRLGRPLRY